MPYQVSMPLGESTLTLEVGKLAKQANGSVFARYGDSAVLAAACRAEPREAISFFPLTVDYREYQSAAGRIPGGFFKREGRPSEKEIVTCRLIDRPVRPMFPDGYKDQIQIIDMVVSADENNDPDVIGVTAGAAALFLSDIPFYTPLAAVRVGLINGRLVTNPTYSERRESLLDMVVAASEDSIAMVEANAQEVSEETINDALQHAHVEIKKIIVLIRELSEKLGIKKMEFTPPPFDKALFQEIKGKVGKALHDAMDTTKYSKLESYHRIRALQEELVAGYPEEDLDKRREGKRYFHMLEEQLFRDDVLTKTTTSGWTTLRRGSSHQLRGGSAASNARLRRIHAR